VEAGLDGHLAISVELRGGVSGVGGLADAGSDGIGIGGDCVWVRAKEVIWAAIRLYGEAEDGAVESRALRRQLVRRETGGGGLLGAAQQSAGEILELEGLGAVAGDNCRLLSCGKRAVRGV
jgi:hypothetical protein